MVRKLVNFNTDGDKIYLTLSKQERNYLMLVVMKTSLKTDLTVFIEEEYLSQE